MTATQAIQTYETKHILTQLPSLFGISTKQKKPEKKSHCFKAHEILQIVPELQVLPLPKGVGNFPDLYIWYFLLSRCSILIKA